MIEILENKKILVVIGSILAFIVLYNLLKQKVINKRNNLEYEALLNKKVAFSHLRGYDVSSAPF